MRERTKKQLIGILAPLTPEEGKASNFLFPLLEYRESIDFPERQICSVAELEPVDTKLFETWSRSRN